MAILPSSRIQNLQEPFERRNSLSIFFKGKWYTVYSLWHFGLTHCQSVYSTITSKIIPIEAGENSRVSRSVSEEARHEPKCDEAWNQLTKNERAHLVSYIKGLSTVRLYLLTYSWCEIVFRLKTSALLDMFTYYSTGSEPSRCAVL